MIIGLILPGMILGMIIAAVALVAGYSLVTAFMVYVGIGVLCGLGIALMITLQAYGPARSGAQHDKIAAISDR